MKTIVPMFRLPHPRLIYIFTLLIALALLATTLAAAPITVATDGTGDFKSVQAAIDSIPHTNDQPQIITIKPGRYYEKLLVVPSYVHLIGSDPQTTILTFDDYATRIGANGKEIGTIASHTLLIKGHDFETDNLTIENTAGPRRVTKQTMAVGVQADRVIFRHCHLLGHQDTLFASIGRQYYSDCLIVGDADFIFGNATAVFDHCEIRTDDTGVITAQERMTPDEPTGFVFNNCKFTSTPDVKKNNTHLGRPFRPYARVILLNCDLGSHIQTDGWTTTQQGDYETSAYFAEYNSTGDAATPTQRVPWSHQLNAAEMQSYLPATFLKGPDNWQPSSPDPDAVPTTQPTTKPVEH